MGFSGGGSNVLKSHTHDGTIVQDGGSLNMDNVTQAALTAGDIVYSDGNHLQRLAIGGSGQSLTSSGSAPQWSAASSAALEKIYSTTLTSDQNAFTASFTAVNQTDIACIYGVLNAESTANENADITINGIGGHLSGNTTYNSQGFFVQSGAIGYQNTTGGEKWRVINEAAGGKYIAQFWISCNPVQDNIQSTWITSGNEGLSYVSGYNTTAGQTSISSITFDFEVASKVYKDGTRLDIYKINV